MLTKIEELEAENARLKSQLAEWESHVKGSFEHLWPDRTFDACPPWQRGAMLVSHCRVQEMKFADFQLALKAFFIDRLDEVHNDIGGVEGYKLELDPNAIRKLFELIDHPEGAPTEPRLFVERK